MPSKSQVRNFNKAVLDSLKDYNPEFLYDSEDMINYKVNNEIVIGLYKPEPSKVYSIHVSFYNTKSMQTYNDEDGFEIFNQFKEDILPLLKPS